MISVILLPRNLTVKLFILLLLSFFSMVATADMYYSISGKIAEITKSSIRLSDRTYPFMPTLKILNIAGQSTTVDSLESGDRVKITILTIDKKRRVDTIQKLASPEGQSSQQ